MKFRTLLFLSLLLIWVVFSLMNTEEVDPKSVMDKAVEIYGGVFSGMENNKPKYRMNAAKVVQDGRKNRFLLDDVDAVFNIEGGVVEVDSDRAFLNHDSEIVRLDGNVRIVGISKEVILTEKLLYNKKTSAIMAPEFVKITAPEYNASGSRMVGNVNSRKYKLIGNTKIDIKGSVIKEN